MQLSNVSFFVLFRLCVVLLLIGTLQPVCAADEWVSSDYVQARIVEGGKNLQTGEVDALLQLRLQEGWHTYWRNAGDTGLPPRFDWRMSKNLKEAALEWPIPKRMTELDFVTFGYEDEISFPLVFTPEDKEKAIEVALDLNVMVCHEICIPQTLRLSKLIEEGNPANQSLIDFANRKVPFKTEISDLKIENVVAGPKGLVISVYSKDGFEGAQVFAMLDDIPFTKKVGWETDEKNPMRARILLPTLEDAAEVGMSDYVSGKTFFITLVVGAHAIEYKIAF